MKIRMKIIYSILFLFIFIPQFEVFPQGTTYSQGPSLNDARTGEMGGFSSSIKMILEK
jgi:hypothetical protein